MLILLYLVYSECFCRDQEGFTDTTSTHSPDTNTTDTNGYGSDINSHDVKLSIPTITFSYNDRKFTAQGPFGFNLQMKIPKI